MPNYTEEELTKLIDTQIQKYLTHFVTTDEKRVQEIRIMDFCIAYIMSLDIKIRILRDALRMDEDIASKEEIDRQAKEVIKQSFNDLMQSYDEARQEVADAVVRYRQQYPLPPAH
jgi:hypothetical protein